MIKITSPNFDKRLNDADPSVIVLHYTGMGNAVEALEVLCDPFAKVSAHYFVDEDGSVLNLVKDNKRAWHAGISYWKGDTDINSRSIGIEIVNPGHEYGYRRFTDAQMNVVTELCRDLIKKYNIRADHILGHSDVAPERKIDPGELFDWQGLAQDGVGLWPEPTQADFKEAADLVKNEYNFQHLLAEFGYNPLAAYVDVVTAFHRHFYPEKFRDGGNPAAVDETSAARLLALVRASRALKT
ncbi:MAG TPA: N-acetylmuramoyl-L-alanine amidase [Rhodospirillaceae bacterium]|nr:N-acetylmuramoyl-L-alanine amidase [Rhodospirillaceae bacterium]